MYAQHIFRAYDIRGKYPNELNEDLALKIGAAFGTINKGKIAVGCDARLSGPSLKEKLIEGLISTGSNVIDVGLITTPIMIFSVGRYGFDGGIVITASHNPKEYNGFKIFTKNAAPISYETGIEKIKGLVNNGNFSKGKGYVEKKNVIDDYSNYLLSKVNFKNKKMKIVVDGGNGAAGKINSNILKKAGFEVIELFCEPDGNFPNHLPDPMEPENIEYIKKKVIETKADIGFAYDGDGDRLGVINDEGKILGTSDVLIILAKHTLNQKKGVKIVVNVACSMAVEESVKKYGGISIDCRVGHTLVTQKMIEEDAEFAGELSGHYFFKETFMGDDGIFASLKLLEFLINNDTNLQKECKEIPRYFSEVAENIVIPIKEELKKSFMDNLKKDLMKKGYKINDIDGVKIIFDEGWLLFRPSNTTPLIRYGFEARTKEEFEKIKQLVEEIKSSVPK
jgi:phosphomannomutase/phosphoglucomutase